MTYLPAAPGAHVGLATTATAGIVRPAAGLSCNALGQVFSGIFNTKAFGAVGDGSSHPASGNGFTTLAALQQAYPFATALTNEMDWLGTQAAINAAKVAGGTVYSPASTYVYVNGSSVADGSGTLTFPEANPFYPNSILPVHWAGDGDGATFHYWPSDLGQGRFATIDDKRVTTTGGNYGRWKDMTFRGPGAIYSPSNIGSKTSQMSGLGLGSGKDLTDISVDGFSANIDFVGGQNKFVGVRSENGYYGLYFSAPNLGLFGDTYFERCIFQNCLMAGAGVHHATMVTECVFMKVTFDVQPWGFFKETNSGTPSNSNTLSGCTFVGTQFEALGNGAIGDDRLVTGATVSAAVGNVFNTSFKDVYFSWDATRKAAAYAALATICLHDANGLLMEGLVGFSPGAAGIFAFMNGAANGVTLRTDVYGLISAANAAPVAARYITVGDQYFSVRLINTGGNAWEGYTALGASPLSVGQICNILPGQYGNAAVGGPTAGTAGDSPGGVVMHVGGGNGTSGTSVLYAERGVVSVNASGTWATGTATGQWVRTGSGGNAVQAASATDAASPMIGLLWAAPASATPTSVTVKLKGLS